MVGGYKLVSGLVGGLVSHRGVVLVLVLVPPVLVEVLDADDLHHLDVFLQPVLIRQRHQDGEDPAVVGGIDVVGGVGAVGSISVLVSAP